MTNVRVLPYSAEYNKQIAQVYFKYYELIDFKKRTIQVIKLNKMELGFYRKKKR